MTEHDSGIVFITGNCGMLARDLAPALRDRGIAVTGADLPELDITDAASVDGALGDRQYTALVNCAAYTAVDRAETDRTAAFLVNGDGPGVLARICAERGIPLIHLSTDFVFDGTCDRPYREDDQPHPLSVYGESKLMGEQAVAAAGDCHLIVRTSWLYGVHGGNFPKTMLRLARERGEITVVADQTGCPTWTVDLSAAITYMVSHIASGMTDDIWGMYHYCSGGMTTWHGLAETVIEEARQYEELKVNHIRAITTKEYPTPAVRPAWSVLDTAKISDVFGIVPPVWSESVRRMIGELYRQGTPGH